MEPNFFSAPVLVSILGFLLVYALGIVMIFRANKWGRRRRWIPLDYIWVPLGGLTGAFLLALWWGSHGAR
jgi:amino acid transporter